MLRDDLCALPQFSKAVFSSLSHEALTDPELLVLTSAGLLLASRSRSLKGLGIALSGWYLSRRADQYVSALDSKMMLLAQVIGASNTSEETNGH